MSRKEFYTHKTNVISIQGSINNALDAHNRIPKGQVKRMPRLNSLLHSHSEKLSLYILLQEESPDCTTLPQFKVITLQDGSVKVTMERIVLTNTVKSAVDAHARRF